MSEIYDIAVIGSGVAGSFAAMKIAHSHKALKVLIIEAGRPSRKRRSQMSGYLGLMPNTDGRLYMPDLSFVESLTTKSKTKIAFDWFKSNTEEVINFDIIKDKSPSISAEKRVKKSGFEVKLNDHIQLFPAEIHNLSKFISDQVTKKENIRSIYDTEVSAISKERGHFLITADEETYKCKRLLVSIGRSGWRQASSLFQQLGIVENNDFAEIGIRIEMSESSMKEFNHSHCSIVKDDITIGPLSWGGTVIPEDHYDMVISSFRGNESRWKSNKVSFNLLSKQLFKDAGVEQANRIGQLTFILTNDRIAREKVSTILAHKSKLSIMPEYNWLINAIEQVSGFIPELKNKAYCHFPTLVPRVSKVKLGTNLSTDMEGLYVAGESARVPGILGAIVSGIIAGESIIK